MYTLVGSLLMLVGAITTGVMAANGGEPNFLLSELAKTPLGSTAQGWIFLAFALAFLIKMPSFPFHGWMPDGYSNMPIGVLAVFTAILSKVAAYGFLQIALPLFPDAAVRYQELIMIVAVASILYGSAMAFTVDSARLVLGYSSIAQLGFIVLGIFAFDGRGADGALLQATNHAIVAGALIFVVAMLARRTGGSEKLSDMGGIAKGAPAFAAVFLVFSFALLAMPGTANFVAEFMILLGTFESKMTFAFIAAIGVALAAFYALRLYISAMHHRVGEKVHSFELTLREGLVLVPLLLVVIALALYPQFALEPAEDGTSRALSAAQQVQSSGSDTSTTAQGAK
jgi:NADH-quinone oxidoreductase subunit M